MKQAEKYVKTHNFGIYLTGDIEQCIAANMNDYIAKLFEDEDMVNKILTQLAKK